MNFHGNGTPGGCAVRARKKRKEQDMSGMDAIMCARIAVLTQGRKMSPAARVRIQNLVKNAKK